MKKLPVYFLICLMFCACKKDFRKNENRESHSISQNNSDSPKKIELKDSAKLRHIKNQFYSDNNGTLYEKTVANREVDGHLQNFAYFNGEIPQEIEPEFFTEIGDSFYYKDRKNVYLIHPTSGGEMILKLENVDISSFKTIKSLYQIGFDKNHFFEGNKAVADFVPKNTEVIYDENGNAVKLKSGAKEFVFGQ